MTAAATDLAVTVPIRSWRRLGATPDASGAAFALWAPRAHRVDLCLVDDGPDGRLVETRIALPEVTQGVHHAHVAGVRPGQRYGFRVHGPWDPARGDRCDPGKLLLDPYARAIDGRLVYDERVFADGPFGADSLGAVPLSVVVDLAEDAYDWADERPPGTPWSQTVVYELHVRGFTMQHPAVPAELRGTYAGLAHPAVIDHLVGLGVTAVELMPVQHFVSERALAEAGEVNAWGYNPIGFFAPHAGYAASGSRGEQVREFRDLVRALHAAGLEVLLDVVYNHTGESDLTGPTLGFRGIDNRGYYRIDGRGRYQDVTGCGNTLDLRQPHVVRLVLDSLRSWVQDMHVDGFRFDLAPALARGDHGVDMRSAFLTALGQDPVLREVKLIAEPWDLGPGGYQLGRFPPLWAEWNDKFRETVRSFWLGAAHGRGGVRDLAYRLSGSSDLYRGDGRRPYASINYVASHDGLTTADLAAASGADWPDRRARALVATTLLATGVPMLLAGDELARTQHGDANAYREDSPVSWLAWPPSTGPDADGMRELVRRCLELRRTHPALRQRHFFDGRPRVARPPVADDGPADPTVAPPVDKDLAWFTAAGEELTTEEWADPDRTTLGMLLDGDHVAHLRAPGAATDVLVWLHTGAEPVEVRLPSDPRQRPWTLLLDTSEPPGWAPTTIPAAATLELAAASVVVLGRD